MQSRRRREAAFQPAGGQATGGFVSPSFAPARGVGAGLVSLGVVREIRTVLRDFGHDADRIIARAGLDPRLFDDPDNAVSAQSLSGLLQLSIGVTDCPHFGLLVGQKASFSSLRIVGDLMRHSPTVEAAMRNLVQYLHVQDRIAVPALSVRDEVAVLSYAIYERVDHADQICDAAIAVGINLLRSLCGGAFAPIEVLLPRQRPADVKPYQTFFRAPVRFDEETASIVFAKGWLDRPVAGADDLKRRVLEERIAGIEARPRGEYKDELRRVLRLRLLERRSSAEQVAAMFAVHRRTLSRRLQAEGTAFKIVADEIRFEIARQLLADTDLSFGQIAATLDFSEASAFTRAFRRWSGQTPTAWRASRRQR